MDAETFLVPDTPPQEITVKKATTTHPDARLGLFSSRTIEKSEVVEYYHGSLARECHRAKSDRGRVLQVTAKTFRK